MQRDLVERARRGDHDAFAELAGAAISRLDSAAWLILRDPEQAADAVQNALVRAWRDLPTLRDPDRFDGWLHRLLVRSCIDEARRLRRHRIDLPITPLDAPVSSDHESVVADRDQIERGFVRLDPEQRAVIVLHHFFDLPLHRGGRHPGPSARDGEVATSPRDRPHAGGARRRRPDEAGDLGGPSGMTANHDFERQLGAWLRDDSAGRVPDHIETVLVQTVATPQRPWWSSPGRWLPFDAAHRRARSPSMDDGRPLLVLVLVALVLAALLILAVGSRRPPHRRSGWLETGRVVVSQNGDLFSVDPKNGLATLLAGNSRTDDDFGPGFSRDGTKLAFLRGAVGGLGASSSRTRTAAPPTSCHRRWMVSTGSTGRPTARRIAFLSHGPCDGRPSHQCRQR